MGGVELEGIANRDSIPYRATYGLQDATSLRTLVRGTLRSVKVLNIESRFSSIYHFRYPGFCTLMQSFKYLGLLEDHEKITIDSWSAFLPRALSVRAKAFSVSDVYMHNGSLETVMREVAPWDQFSKTSGKTTFRDALGALEWLGLWSTDRSSEDMMTSVAVPSGLRTPLELFAIVLAHRLRYAAAERDMVVLSHEVIVRDLGGAHEEEVHKSSLVVYGDESASAMARTVGLPVAFAALEILDGKVRARGVTGPNEREVYEAVLGRLDRAGLGMVESVEIVDAACCTVEKSLHHSS